MENEESKAIIVGLSSQDAQHSLHVELRQFASNCSRVEWCSEIIRSPYVLISCGLTAVAAVLLLTEFLVSGLNFGRADATVLLQAIVLLIFVILNFVLFLWELYILKTRRIRRLLSHVKPLLRLACPWTVHSYPKSPISTLRGHFTVPAYRDNSRVNLPTSLLVKGDVIELQCDVPSPAKVSLLPSDSEKDPDHVTLTLELGEVPPPEIFTSKPRDNDVVSFIPHIAPFKWVVLETPIVSLLSTNVTKRRPKTVLTKEKNRILALLEVLVGVVWLFSLLYNIIRYFSLTSDFDNSWPELILMQPVYTVLPILLVPLPLVWTIVNLYGTATVTLMTEKQADFSSFNKRTFIKSVKNLCITLSRMCALVWNHATYPNYRAFHILGSLTSVCAVDKEYLLTGGFPTPEKVFVLRTEEVAEGNLERTNLDDRERGLSETIDEQTEFKSQVIHKDDSYPTLRLTVPDQDNRTEASQHDSTQCPSGRLEASNPLTDANDLEDSLSSAVAHTPTLDSLSVQHSRAPDSLSTFSDFAPIEVIKEILDISPSFESVSGVCFDDVNWQMYMGSLKPVGVNLLATSHLSKQCSNWQLPGMSPKLAQLIDQTSCSCSLGVEIGVSEYASTGFERHVLLYSFGEPPPANDPTLNFRANSALSTFFSHSVQPHIISLAMKALGTSNYLLMSRGSGDMVTSCCSDFWDGKDLQPMTDFERSTIMEFYNRRSNTGYCIALAYNPLLTANSLPAKNTGIFVPASQITRNYSEMTMMCCTDEGPSQLTTASQVFGLLQCNQVFLGLLSFQFKAKMDVVSLIEDLQTAGIRFVHFTCENEVRGKGFAQKLGLEADWNCHISLAPGIEHEDIASEIDSSDLDISRSSSASSSLSSFINTNMSNYRAKLPIGIESVRPHIKDVDNVPLQVPLFTDCTTDTIREMIEILQENSEVVLCLGNAWNRENLSIFSQADISLSLIPEYVDNSTCIEAETCALSTSNSSQNTTLLTRHSVWPSPLEMAAYLNSTTSQLCFSREHDISLLCLITESRHIQSMIRHGFLFALGSVLSLVFLLLFTELFFLPPPLGGSHLFWFVFFVIPCMSLTYLSIPMDPKIKYRLPSRKKLILNERYSLLINFALTFIPTVVLCVLLFGLTLMSICSSDIPDSDCHPLLGNRNDSSMSAWNGWRGDYEQGLVFAQDVIAFFLCLYLVAHSVRFIHRTKPLWKLWRFVSWQYICILVGIVTLQVIYFVISQVFAVYVRGLTNVSSLVSVPFYVWIIGFVWPFVIVVPQELLKFHDKRKLFKLQTRLKLDFETKLGEYSPM